MARKEVYKGLDVEALKKVTMEEFMEMTNSRDRRTLKRLNQNPTLKKFIEKIREYQKTGSKKVIKTHIREAVILPEWLGLKIGVYNGKEYRQIEITYDKLGRRLGDFSHSVGRVLHSGPGVGATRGSKFVPLK